MTWLLSRPACAQTSSSQESGPGSHSAPVSKRNHPFPSCADKRTIVPWENLLESNARSPGRNRNSLLGHSLHSLVGSQSDLKRSVRMHVWLWKASSALQSWNSVWGCYFQSLFRASFGCSSHVIFLTGGYIIPPATPPFFSPHLSSVNAKLLFMLTKITNKQRFFFLFISPSIKLDFQFLSSVPLSLGAGPRSQARESKHLP